MLYSIGFAVIGLALIILGTVMKTQNLPSLSFDVNYKNVKEADYEKYTRAYGYAYILTGVGMIIYGLTGMFINGYYQTYGFFIFSILLLIATIMVLRIKRKFKTGLFH